MQRNKRSASWTAPNIIHAVPTIWGWVVWHPKNLILGKHVDIGYGCYLNAKHGLIIEDGVQIGSHCSIYSESSINEKSGRILICKNAKIGAHSVILPNVIIGEECEIFAGSIVSRNIPKGFKGKIG